MPYYMKQKLIALIRVRAWLLYSLLLPLNYNLYMALFFNLYMAFDKCFWKEDVSNSSNAEAQDVDGPRRSKRAVQPNGKYVGGVWA